ncbi:MAG TPA: hypothetical protein VIN61_10570 [Gammaproteobacteria bacterium]
MRKTTENCAKSRRVLLNFRKQKNKKTEEEEKKAAQNNNNRFAAPRRNERQLGRILETVNSDNNNQSDPALPPPGFSFLAGAIAPPDARDARRRALGSNLLHCGASFVAIRMLARLRIALLLYALAFIAPAHYFTRAQHRLGRLALSDDLSGERRRPRRDAGVPRAARRRGDATAREVGWQ